MIRINLYERFWEVMLLNIAADPESNYILPEIFNLIVENIWEVGVRTDSDGRELRKWYQDTQKEYGHPIEIHS